MALLLQAMNKYEEALNSNTNVETLMNCSIAFYNFLLIKGGEKGSGANEDSFERTDPGVQKLEGFVSLLSPCFFFLLSSHTNKVFTTIGHNGSKG